MGSRITKRLLAKGHAVTGYDLFPAKQPELVAMGGKWASSPRAVCEAADTTFVMVTNTAALEARRRDRMGCWPASAPASCSST
jgi:3-hydroxyisobutyrate dehydrogenase-like beta-hydroxyacid dehydrogenase